MNKKITLFLIILAVLISPLANAEEISFPQTAAEISKALQFKQGRVTYEGVEYEIEQNNVFKIINGKRFRMRGLKTIEIAGITPKVGASIHFDTDSVQIKPESFGLLNEFGDSLSNDLKGADIIIAGHTDSLGSVEYNQLLSKKRAESVATYLVSKFKISSERIKCRGFGEAKPLADNSTEIGKSKNRRVEFIRIK